MGISLLQVLGTAVAVFIFGLGQSFAGSDAAPSSPPKEVVLLLFWAENCPHCGREKSFLDTLTEKYPRLIVDDREIWNNRTHFEQFKRLCEIRGGPISTPATFIGHSAWYGFNREIATEIEEAVRSCLVLGCPHPLEVSEAEMTATGPPETSLEDDQKTFTVPGLGPIDPRRVSLPLFTLVIGFLDGFNPCAFFVFLFLLSLLVHLHSRARMLLVGGVFIFFSGFFYFIFMAAWLNIFLTAGHLRMVTLTAGVIAVFMGSVNIKDFFFFKKGFSLSLSEEAKPKLFRRMRGLLSAPRLSSLLLATVVLAAAANSYELLCTAGFPMVYARVLTLQDLSSLQYYLFLSLYNLVYISPLIIILVIMTLTLGQTRLSEWQGRVLKLLSGIMMFGLGSILMFRPSLLNHLGVALALLAGAALVTFALTRFFRPRH